MTTVNRVTDPLGMNNYESNKRGWYLRDPLRQATIFSFTIATIAEFLLGSYVANGINYVPLGRVSLVALTLFVVFHFALSNRLSRKVLSKDLLTLGSIFIASFTIIGIGRFILFSVCQALQQNSFWVGISEYSLYFGLPLAAGAMLLQLTLGMRFGLVLALSLAHIIFIYVPEMPTLSPFVLITSYVGCVGLTSVRSRASYFRAGWYVSLVSAVFASVSIIAAGEVAVPDLLAQILSSIFGGLLCFLIVSGFAPVLELVGGYVTDLRLIEMATLDNPLLKELSIQAPGTWNHSMVMGMMTEVAADSIGANPVLARVGSYFHDVGKVKKPLYFVENQSHGENRHDRLSPSMSALIIRSHVKDGLDLAKQHNLPEVLKDMILQHHGTSVIEFFYERALKEAEAQNGAQEVDISHYTYPGPRPQSREAGILMLADGIEAASRTLKEPNPDRIQGAVQRMINKVFASGQLNECDLTLQDLHQIAKCFTRVLSGIYHQRVAYSEPVEKGVVRQSTNIKGDLKKNEEIKSEENIRNESKEDLKRLGLE
jgi:cyclic-di-AMP phosphodiesterase PgpH